MTADFEVRYTEMARDDLIRLFDFLIERAQTVEDFDAAQLAIDIISTEVAGQLSRSPFIFRKAGESPFLRELIIPFCSAGYVVFYEIENGATVTILAVRHQIEDDYHCANQPNLQRDGRRAHIGGAMWARGASSTPL